MNALAVVGLSAYVDKFPHSLVLDACAVLLFAAGAYLVVRGLRHLKHAPDLDLLRLIRRRR
jgi:hypothetical protein